MDWLIGYLVIGSITLFVAALSGPLKREPSVEDYAAMVFILFLWPLALIILLPMAIYNLAVWWRK